VVEPLRHMDFVMTQSLERLEKLEGYERDLDFEILKATGVVPETAKMAMSTAVWFEGAEIKTELVQLYTQSVDAALALVARALPGWRPSIHITQANAKPFCALVVLTNMETEDDDEEPVKSKWMPTAALALCLATLQALRKEKR
jgi:hypothetical protein